MVSGKTRLKFYKVGKLKFISHLDLVRTLKGALLRAKIPLYYTEGFNPHPKMVFALPIALGDESICEYLDIRLTKAMDEQALLDAVNAQLTKEMQFTAVYPVDRDFHEITSARYRMLFRGIDAAALETAMGGSLPVVKKSKKGMVEVDLKPNILSYKIREKDGELCMTAMLSASEKNFVNPENLVKALSTSLGSKIDDYDILREEIYIGSEIFH